MGGGGGRATGTAGDVCPSESEGGEGGYGEAAGVTSLKCIIIPCPSPTLSAYNYNIIVYLHVVGVPPSYTYIQSGNGKSIIQWKCWWFYYHCCLTDKER